jgi:hypothetical protein
MREALQGQATGDCVPAVQCVAVACWWQGSPMLTAVTVKLTEAGHLGHRPLGRLGFRVFR